MGSPKSPERDETPHTRFCDLKAFEMLNDLLMLTKFNRNAESERARSGAFRRGEELGFECDVGRRGVRSEGARARGARREERPFDAKTRWRILKNNTRLILPRSLGPSAILHSQGGEGGEGGGLFPSLPSILLSSPLLSSPARRASFILGRVLGARKTAG